MITDKSGGKMAPDVPPTIIKEALIRIADELSPERMAELFQSRIG